MTDYHERLVGTAIKRDGFVHEGTRRGHWEIRSGLGDDDPRRSKPGDVDGFMTSADRFVDRGEANEVAVISGQCRRMGRPMLSSDVDWDARPPKKTTTTPPPSRKTRMFRP
jgi:hypothetical protein